MVQEAMTEDEVQVDEQEWYVLFRNAKGNKPFKMRCYVDDEHIEMAILGYSDELDWIMLSFEFSEEQRDLIIKKLKGEK